MKKSFLEILMIVIYLISIAFMTLGIFNIIKNQQFVFFIVGLMFLAIGSILMLIVSIKKRKLKKTSQIDSE